MCRWLHNSYYNKWITFRGVVKKNEGKWYELNELYRFHIIDVNFWKENIFAVILLQLSEARSFHHRQETAAWAETACDDRVSKYNTGIIIQATINISISVMWVIAWSGAVTGSSLLWAHNSVITLPLSQPCWAPRLLLSLPLQIHRSLHKVKQAGPVYFGRWNMFWKSNKSAKFSFSMVEGAEGTKACVNSRTKGVGDKLQHDRDDRGGTHHMLYLQQC